MHAIDVSNPNVPIFPPRVCTLVLFIILAVRAIREYNERCHRVKRQICGNIKKAFFLKNCLIRKLEHIRPLLRAHILI